MIVFLKCGLGPLYMQLSTLHTTAMPTSTAYSDFALHFLLQLMPRAISTEVFFSFSVVHFGAGFAQVLSLCDRVFTALFLGSDSNVSGVTVEGDSSFASPLPSAADLNASGHFLLPPGLTLKIWILTLHYTHLCNLLFPPGSF